jgi:hypothetical protein
MRQSLFRLSRFAVQYRRALGGDTYYDASSLIKHSKDLMRQSLFMLGKVRIASAEHCGKRELLSQPAKPLRVQVVCLNIQTIS